MQRGACNTQSLHERTTSMRVLGAHLLFQQAMPFLCTTQTSFHEGEGGNCWCDIHLITTCTWRHTVVEPYRSAAFNEAFQNILAGKTKCNKQMKESGACFPLTHRSYGTNRERENARTLNFLPNGGRKELSSSHNRRELQECSTQEGGVVQVKQAKQERRQGGERQARR